MRPLDLDFAPAPRIRLAGCILLGLAVVCAAALAVRYRALVHEIQVKEARLAQAVRADQPKLAQRPMNAEEYKFARETAWRLGVPWDRLFRGLEAAAIDRVALLAIEPDLERRTITISGEAKDYLATLSYVAGLSDQREAFARVYLQRHEMRAGAAERPLAFTVSATWGRQP